MKFRYKLIFRTGQLLLGYEIIIRITKSTVSTFKQSITHDIIIESYSSRDFRFISRRAFLRNSILLVDDHVQILATRNWILQS